MLFHLSLCSNVIRSLFLFHVPVLFSLSLCFSVIFSPSLFQCYSISLSVLVLFHLSLFLFTLFITHNNTQHSTLYKKYILQKPHTITTRKHSILCVFSVYSLCILCVFSVYSLCILCVLSEGMGWKQEGNGNRNRKGMRIGIKRKWE